MNPQSSNKISIPDLDYKAIQTEAMGILDNARNGNLRSAMVAYITTKQSKLPENTTVDNAVDSILKVSNDFASALPNDITQDDIENMLRRNIRKLTSQQAVVYLATLETIFNTLDEAAVSGSMPDTETLKNKFQNMAEDAENNSIDELRSKISNLAKSIQSDSLKASVYATGNNELGQLITNRETVVLSETAEQIHNILLNETRKHELYAATACICYSMALEGKIKGVSANHLDAGILTALVAAGLEKASVLHQYATGKINEEKAQSMLSVIARVLKWILAGAVFVLVAYGLSLAAALPVGFFSAMLGLAYSVPLMITISMMIGIYFTFYFSEHINNAVERICEFLGHLMNKAKQIFSSNKNKASNKNENALLHKTSTTAVEEEVFNKNTVKQSAAY